MAVQAGHANARSAALSQLDSSYRSVLASSPAYRALVSTLQTQQQRHAKWRGSRLQLLASVNANRCAGPGGAGYAAAASGTGSTAAAGDGVIIRRPMCSSDLLDVLDGVAEPFARCLNTDTLLVTDYPWSYHSTASVVPQGYGTTAAGGVAGLGPSSSTPAAASSASAVVRLRGLPRAAQEALRRLLLPSLVLGLSSTYAERAEACDTLMREFMVYIPKVCRGGGGGDH